MSATHIPGLPPGHLPPGHLPGGAPSAPVPPSLNGAIPNFTETFGSGTQVIALGDYFFGAESFSISPAIPGTWSFDTVTGELSVPTDLVGTFGAYVVTATNTEGSTPSNSFFVIVSASTSGGGGTSSGTDYGLTRISQMPDYRKTPDETVRVKFTWAARLNGETILSASYELPDGMTNAGEEGTNSQRSVLVSGGGTGFTYRVVARIVTSGGQTLSSVKRVSVLEG